MNTPLLRRLNDRDADFDLALDALLARQLERDPELEQTVRDIIEAVATRGDAALLEYTARFDRRAVERISELEVPAASLRRALEAIDPALRDALERSHARIDAYHRQQLPASWSMEDALGNRLGQLVRPLDRVGLYVPGGQASYPSSVLMNAVPARVAGVRELIMTVPAPGGELSPVVLAAAAIAGVDRVFTVGGAQAVAALALGGTAIPRVDKIVGPGNRFVAEAKRQVYGRVGLDMLAGPSEVLIITDGSVAPRWLALDLFAQAEHDVEAQSLLMCPDAGFLDRLEQCIAELLPQMQRREIIAASLRQRGALLQVRDIATALRLSNRLAPEHLELALADAESHLDAVRHAGAIFVGRFSAEALGDYCAGPSHVLPTAGAARFASPLDVHDFLKRSSLIQCSDAGGRELAALAARVADSEGLQAHALSAACRLEDEGRSQ